MKKLINWFIHLLGGYTREEYRDELFKRADMVRTGSELLEKYTTEHEAYLALLNCHNAAAAAQNGTAGVSGAIDTIKAYCKSKGSCDECALYNKNGGCKIHEIPCYWGVE